MYKTVITMIYLTTMLLQANAQPLLSTDPKVKAENLKILMNENHNLDDLEFDTLNYLKENLSAEQSKLTELETQLLILKSDHSPNSKDIFIIVQSKKKEFERAVYAAFNNLKTDLDQIHTMEQQASSKIEDTPIVPIMIRFKKALFAAKKTAEKELANTLVVSNSKENESALLRTIAKEYVLIGGKTEAIKGILNLKPTGQLNTILLKIGFSLVVAEMRTPFVELAPKDVQNHFEVYLALLKKGLKTPFFEFYQNTEQYLKEFDHKPE